MSELKFNIKDSTGADAFITPMIVIASKTAKLEKVLTGTPALQFGYVVKSYIEKAYTDKTKLEAGHNVIDALTGAVNKAKDTTVSVYMPTLDTDRNNSDIKKWTHAVTLTGAELLPLVTKLSAGYDLFLKQAELFAGFTSPDVQVTQPVYFSPPAGQVVSKKSGKGKVVTSLFD